MSTCHSHTASRLSLHPQAILAAKYEAMSAYRGIGLVKLMGRHSGFIAVKVGALAAPWLGRGSWGAEARGAAGKRPIAAQLLLHLPSLPAARAAGSAGQRHC